jgi:pimeloyl-ACP methyl ester carboxylesterase
MGAVRVPLPLRVLPAIAERAWFTPPRPSDRTRARDAQALESVEPISVEVEGRARPGFLTGEGPLLILVHGWGGRAAQMLDLAQAAARHGYRAVAIDAPGHNTDHQRDSDGFQIAAGIEAVEATFGTPEVVIAHSLGAIATVMAFRNRAPRTTVWLAPVLDVRDSLRVFSHRAKLAPWTVRSLRRRVKRFIGDWWPALTAGGQTDLPGTNLLIIHDPADLDADFRLSAAMADRRPNTRLVEAPGAGHNLLRDANVIDSVEHFLDEARVVDTHPGH